MQSVNSRVFQFRSVSALGNRGVLLISLVFGSSSLHSEFFRSCMSTFRLLFVYRTDCTRFTCSFLASVYRVLSSDIGSAHLRHRDLPPCHRPWRLRIGSPSLARKSLHHSLIDLSHELPDVNLPIMAKDKYLNFGALSIRRPSLRAPRGATTA